ncbi:MAG: hypothetical protein MJ163_01685 [Alphaproteobacteria bacterium]|nr:hypothetical protein [Alphaproteobacteria bacterium]
MNNNWSLHLKITNWCNLNCAHCCECSNSAQPLNLLSLEKIEKYLHEIISMPIKPNELISIGGGEVMAPYMHNTPEYIPNLLDIVYKYEFVPTLKTNGTWGEQNKKRTKILSDIAKRAYKSGKLVTLDISVDEFHNNTDGVAKIIRNVVNEYYLCYAIRICLVGFNTPQSAKALLRLKQELSKNGFHIEITPPFGDWIISAPNGTTAVIYTSFTSGIFDIGRAKKNKNYTTTGNRNNTGTDCLQIDNNDIATYNYGYCEPVQNRNLYEVLCSLQQRTRE